MLPRAKAPQHPSHVAFIDGHSEAERSGPGSFRFKSCAQDTNLGLVRVALGEKRFHCAWNIATAELYRDGASSPGQVRGVPILRTEAGWTLGAQGQREASSILWEL